MIVKCNHSDCEYEVDSTALRATLQGDGQGVVGIFTEETQTMLAGVLVSYHAITKHKSHISLCVEAFAVDFGDPKGEK